MGFLTKLFKPIATIAGGLIGGPAGAMVGGAIGGAGDLLQSKYDRRQDDRSAQAMFDQQYQLNEQTNAQRIAAADAQMDFQERMSNTSHQREMTDLRKAGLNPLLAAKYGGSSTPGGAMPSLVNSADSAASSALAKRGQEITRRKNMAEMSVMDAQLDKIKAETEASRATARNTDANTARTLGMTPHDIEVQKARVQEVWRNVSHKIGQTLNLDQDTENKIIDGMKKVLEVEYMNYERTGKVNMMNLEKQLHVVAGRAGVSTGAAAANAAKTVLNAARSLFK